MARDGSGNYTLPANTLAVSGDPISSTKFNTLVQDLEADANVDRPITAGGTGASTAAGARTNLGLAIGTDVQAFDAGLLSIAGLTTQADRSIYTTASDTYAVYTLTAAGRAILDDADASAQRTTLGLGTAAVKNTGTSGDAVPLLNAANTFSDTVTATRFQVGTFVMDDNIGLGADIPGFNFDSNVWFIFKRSDNYFQFAISGTEVARITSTGATILNNTVWHAGNDGAGSGLDADTLDGVQPSAFALTILDDADASAVRATIGAGIGDMLKSDNLSGLTNYATARTNLGLAIGTDVQAFDAGLQSIAGLTTTADQGIYTTASDTYAVYTLTAAGRALLDDADASAQRTTLGLGTAATVNTGTSGATIPLLNGNNNFSGATEISGSLTISAGASGSEGGEFNIRKPPSGSTLAGDVIVDIYANTLRIFENGGSFRGVEIDLTAQGSQSKIWTSGNDGAGSGLDADTLDGVQGSAFALLATDNTFARNLTFSGYRNITVPTGNAAGRIQGRYDTTGGFHDHLITGVNWLRNASGSSGVIDSAANGTAEIEMVATNGASGVIRLRTGAVNTAPTDRVVIDNSGLQARAAASTETTGTLTVASANTTIQATGDVTINNSVFAAGDIIVIYAGASSRTITQGSGVTMRLGGSATTGSRTLAARGVAMLFFVSASEVVVSGGAVT